jgi:hypothetical protein
VQRFFYLFFGFLNGIFGFIFGLNNRLLPLLENESSSTLALVLTASTT